MRATSSLVLCALAAGCSDYEYTELTVTEHFGSTLDATPADLLLVVDDSASMEEEQARLAENFQALIAVLVESTADFRIGVTTTDLAGGGRLRGGWADPDTPELEPALREAVAVGTGGDRNEQGLAVAVQALDDRVNPGFWRDDARAALVFFSDEDDHSPFEVPRYLESFGTLAGSEGFAVHAIVGDLPQGCASGIGAAEAGTRYLAAADLTGGWVDSICAADYLEVLERIGLDVAGLQDTFPLSELPEEESLRVWVDFVEMPRREVDGWDYSRGDNAIVFHGRSVPRAGMEVVVEYEKLLGVDED